jgi:hypothetical protein
MGHDIRISARKGDTEYTFYDYSRCPYHLKPFASQFPNDIESELTTTQVEELLDILYQYFDEWEHNEEVIKIFVLPRIIKDGYKVYLTNSY